jgi:UDP-2,3-diacylglucosamine pyrophosphatase LpxH
MQIPFDPLLASALRPHPPIFPSRIRRHRTIFVSDAHLGTRSAQAELLADFLAHNDCRTLYLIGDIVDGWQLKKGWYWAESHSNVLHEILRKVQDGTRVFYVPGNHDEVFRDYCGLNLAGVEIRRDAIHESAGGKHFLICHGDQFDGVVTCGKWLAYLGDWAYDLALSLNIFVNAVQRLLGLPHWSLSAFLKYRVNNAAQYISDFEHALAREARMRGADGVICGHIHHPAIRVIDGILYANDGDWVESCTALIEDAQGRFEILRWTRFAATESQHAAAPVGQLIPAAA